METNDINKWDHSRVIQNLDVDPVTHKQIHGVEETCVQFLLQDLKSLKKQLAVAQKEGKLEQVELKSGQGNPNPQIIAGFHTGLGLKAVDSLIETAERALAFAQGDYEKNFDSIVADLVEKLGSYHIQFNEKTAGPTVLQKIVQKAYQQKAENKSFQANPVPAKQVIDTKTSPNVGYNRFAPEAAQVQSPKKAPSETIVKFEQLVQSAEKAFEEGGRAKAESFIFQAIVLKGEHGAEFEGYDLGKYIDISVKTGRARAFEDLVAKADQKLQEGHLEEATNFINQACALKLKYGPQAFGKYNQDRYIGLYVSIHRYKGKSPVESKQPEGLVKAEPTLIAKKSP